MTINATDFSPDGAHAGTEADPWPGVAIKDAIDSLNDATDTVMVANGIWMFDGGTLYFEKQNWTLQGESRDGAILKFKNSGSERPDGGIWVCVRDQFLNINRNNIHFTNLTIDPTPLTTQSKDDYSVLRVSRGTNGSFSNCKILGHANGGRPATFWEGGDHNTFDNNIFDGREVGGDNCIQWQPIGNTSLDSHLVVSNNIFHSCALVVIGMDEVLIEGNNCDSTNGGFISLVVSGKWDTTAHNIIVRNNTVDCGGANGAAISGLPNDPGGMSVIDGFSIVDNFVRGTFAAIHCQSFDANNYPNDDLAGNEKHNVVISGNTIHSFWGGSGINLKGGAGLVDTVLVENNVLTNDAGMDNILDRDANTRNVTVRGNTGIPNDDGTEPPIEPPIEPPVEPPVEPEPNTVTITVNANPPGSVNFVLPQGAQRRAKAKPQGKPPKPPAQPPTVTVEVAVDPADSSNIVFAGNAVG